MHKKFDELRKQAEFNELPQCVTLVLWRCRGRDVTLHNTDLNRLVLESQSEETLEMVQRKLDEN